MAKPILSIGKSQEDLWEEARALGSVWIKTESGFVTKDRLDAAGRWAGVRTSIYGVFLYEGSYGERWAFSREELERRPDSRSAGAADEEGRQ